MQDHLPPPPPPPNFQKTQSDFFKKNSVNLFWVIKAKATNADIHTTCQYDFIGKANISIQPNTMNLLFSHALPDFKQARNLAGFGQLPPYLPNKFPSLS